MSTSEKFSELARLEAAFDEAGGRGVELADRIDALREELEGLRNCDKCGRVTDAGEFPDWVDGTCELCDPEVLDHPDNVERVSPQQLAAAKAEVARLRASRN